MIINIKYFKWHIPVEYCCTGFGPNYWVIVLQTNNHTLKTDSLMITAFKYTNTPHISCCLLADFVCGWIFIYLFFVLIAYHNKIKFCHIYLSFGDSCWTFFNHFLSHFILFRENFRCSFHFDPTYCYVDDCDLHEVKTIDIICFNCIWANTFCTLCSLGKCYYCLDR